MDTAIERPPDSRDPDDGVIVTDPRRQRMILIAMCTALIAVVASVSGLNVAQQDLAIDLGASQGQLLWVINGYTMALAALLLPIGAIGDRWGRKPILVSGLVLFALANTAAAFAGSTSMLLAARVVAGVAAAMIMPVTLSVITSSFPAEQRARAVGIWSGFAGAGGILGLFVSSFLIDYFTWPWLFAMPVLFASVSLVLTVRVVGNSREDHGGRFDTVGSVLSAVAIGALVLGIHEGPERGWTDGLALAGLVVGVLALVGFVAWELRNTHPLLEVRLFADRALAAGSLTLLIVFAVMFGIFLVLVQFFQAVLGWSALGAAAGLLPMAIVMMPLSAVAPTIAKRVGTRRVLMTGTALFGAGLAMMATMVSAVRRLLVGDARTRRAGRRHRTRHEPVDDVDHRVAAGREAGRRLGAQRHRARARRRRRHRPARLARQRRLPLEHLVGDRRPGARRGPPGRGRHRLGVRRRPAARRPPGRASSTPPATRSSTAGACRCGSAWRWPRRPCCTSSSAGPKGSVGTEPDALDRSELELEPAVVG